MSILYKILSKRHIRENMGQKHQIDKNFKKYLKIIRNLFHFQTDLKDEGSLSQGIVGISIIP